MQLPTWLIARRATPHKAAAFPFFYIEPAKNKEVIQPYVKNGFPVEQMAPIGEPRVGSALCNVCSSHVCGQQHWLRGQSVASCPVWPAVWPCHVVRGRMWVLPPHLG